MVRPRFFLIAGMAGLALTGAGVLVARAVSPEVREAGPVAEVPAAAVVTVAAALPPGHIIRDSDLSALPWAAAQPPVGAVMNGSAEAGRLIGSVTRRAFAPGELLLADSVIQPGERGFLAAIITPGRRAIAVPVEAATAAGGLIFPGDRVDVILTQEIRDDGVSLGQRVLSETVLADARVLSADQSLQPASEATGGIAADHRAPAVVTLEVTPDDAERLMVAATLGTLRLALRGVAADQVATLDDPAFLAGPGSGEGSEAATWAGEVSPGLGRIRRIQPNVTAAPQPSAPAPRAEPAEPRGTRIYRGSQGA